MLMCLGNFCTPNKSSRSAARTPGSAEKKRDALVKVTFCVHHDANGAEDACMYVVGSLPSLGCWDHKKARKMVLGSDGTYTLAVYIPEKVEFLYQYILARGDADPGAVIWEGAVERKCRVEEACSTPGRRLLLEDDTRGENTNISIVPAVSHEVVRACEKAQALQDAELDNLLTERSLCQVTLAK